MRVTSATSLRSEINVTPLVDVCLVLLIIFMVVTPVLVNGFPVRLPESSTAGPFAKQPMQITVNDDGTIYLDNVAIRGDQLASELQRRRDQILRPVVVRADKNLAYGDVVRVLDTCRSAGFENVGLATMPR
jgi:biopolymer transport protein TolR